MTDVTGIDWEDAFAVAVHIPDGESYAESWAERARRFRASAKGSAEIAYGKHPRERFDLFRPQGQARGLAVIIHGGFWLAFDKSSWSDLAAGALSKGWAVMLPSYTLAPDATVPEMTAQIGQAIANAAELIDGPIRLAGHSAGGHLATRMICVDTPLPSSVMDRIERVVSISGLHDLRPLLLHSRNERLGLTPESAAQESAALCQPISNATVTAWVGALERPEFVRQSALLAEAWTNSGKKTDLIVEPARHHFDVIDGLKDAGHPLTEAFAGV